MSTDSSSTASATAAVITSSPSSSSTSTSYNDPDALAIGLSIGITAAVLGIILAIFALWRYRMEKRKDISRIHGQIEMLPETPAYEHKDDSASERSGSTDSLPSYAGDANDVGNEEKPETERDVEP